MSSAESDDNQEPAESGFQIIRQGIEQVSQEKYFGEIFQRNLEENTDIDKIDQEMQEYGLDPRDFPAICLKLGLDLLMKTDKDPLKAIDGDSTSTEDVFTDKQIEEINQLIEEKIGEEDPSSGLTYSVKCQECGEEIGAGYSTKTQAQEKIKEHGCEDVVLERQT